jgi:ArsR family transcriptional regulator
MTVDESSGQIEKRQYVLQGAPMPRTKLATLTAEQCCPSVLGAPLDDVEAAGLAKGFAALADPARLRLLSLLAAAEGGEVCACDLVEPLGKSQPTVSHHLKVLAEAGLVVGDKRGRWVWYSVVAERIEDLRGALAP